MSAVQTYVRHPTADVGLLTEALFEPLPCIGIAVELRFYNGACRISMKTEHRNDTSASQVVMGAFFVPEGWTFIGSRADGSGRYVLSTLTETDSVVPHYALKEGASSQRAAIAVPWRMLVGETVVLTSTFLCPIDGVSFVLPTGLFPHAGAVSPATEFRSRFTIQAPAKMPEGVLSVHATGSLNGPLLQAPTISGADRPSSSLVDNGQGFEVSFAAPVGGERGDYTFNFLYKPRPVGYGASALDIDVVEETNVDEVGAAATRAVALTIWPDFTPEQYAEPNSEVYLIVGVGNGASVADMSAVKEAVRVALQGLPASCNVNAVCCTGNAPGDDIWLFTDDGAATVPLHQQHFGMGGPIDRFVQQLDLFSHIAPANKNFVPQAMSRPTAIVRELVAAPYVEGLARNIVVITTDGGDKQCSEMSQLLRANVHSTSVSALALNTTGSADVAFLRHIAAVSGGVFEVAANSAEVTEGLVGILAAMVVPSITHTSLRITSSAGEDLLGSKTYFLCGCGPTTVPMIRAGRPPVVVYALGFGEEPTQLNITVDGLVGVHRLQQVLDVPNLAEAPTNTCVKNDPTTYSLLHQLCAMSLVQHAVTTGNLGALSGGTATSLGVPSPFSQFGCRDNSGSTSAALAVVPQPLRRLIGRGAPLPPTTQQASSTCISSTPNPLPSVAVSNGLQKRILKADNTRFESEKAAREIAYEAGVRRGKALGQDDAEENPLDNERAAIDALRNETAASLLPSTPAAHLSTYDFLRVVVERLAASVYSEVSPVSILEAQLLSGSFPTDSPLVATFVGVTPRQLAEAMPSYFGSATDPLAAWTTAVVVAKVSKLPSAVLAVRKGRSYLASVINVDEALAAASSFLPQ